MKDKNKIEINIQINLNNVRTYKAYKPKLTGKRLPAFDLFSIST
jgi:hypothetical protein